MLQIPGAREWPNRHLKRRAVIPASEPESPNAIGFRDCGAWLRMTATPIDTCRFVGFGVSPNRISDSVMVANADAPRTSLLRKIAGQFCNNSGCEKDSSLRSE